MVWIRVRSQVVASCRLVYHENNPPGTGERARLDRHRSARHVHTVTLLLLALLAGGCTAGKVAEENAAKAMGQNILLQNENDRLRTELEEKNVLTAKLQMELVKKQEEIIQLNSTRQGLAKEIAQKTIRPPAANTKVETVAYIAEITTEIQAIREESRPEEHTLFEQADALIQESNSELEQDRFEQASLLAAQAMELVNRQHSASAPGHKVKSGSYAEFITPLELKLAMRSNVRTAPATRSKLVTTVDSGTRVTAAGHKGSWIKVVLPDGRQGWIYYVLLSIPEELNTLEK